MSLWLFSTVVWLRTITYGVDMNMRSRIAMAGVLVLGGCSGAKSDNAKPAEAAKAQKTPADGGKATANKEEHDGKKAEAAPPDAKTVAVAEKPIPEADADEAKLPEIAMVTVDEAGPIQRDMGEADELTAALPGVTLTTETQNMEGQDYDIHQLSRDGKPFATVQPSRGKIYDAYLYDPMFRGPHEIRPGVSLTDLGIVDKVLGCDVEVEGEARVLCGIEDSAHVQVVFDATIMKGISPGRTIAVSRVEKRPIFALRWMPNED